MNLKAVIAGLVSCVFLVSCEGENKTNPVEEPEIKLQFETNSLSLAIESESEIVISIEPAKKASSVEIVNSDEKVVEIKDKEIKDGKITLSLETLTLGTCTIAAAIEDQYGECSIEVLPVSAESITLDRQELDINIYDQYTFNVTITPENTTSPVVEWSSSDEKIAVVNHGTVVGRTEGSAVITANIGEVKAECTVNVHEVKGESLTLDIESREISKGETFLVTATLLPENVTVKGMQWSIVTGADVISFEVVDPKEDDNQTSARVAGVSEGEAVLQVKSAGLAAECKVTVKKAVAPVTEVKIGDYYYSDGTWSDGGLLGYEVDGLTPIWASPKPSPEEGKTLIGIVFSTDQTRISSTEQALGYTHGLVVALKGAHAAGETETMYSFDSSFEKIPNKKRGTAWYADIEGYQWTQEIIAAYPGEKIQQCPAFDWTVTDFSPSAPTNTSGWYVPSVGQIWDLLANLGGGELAKALKTLQSFSEDISYYYRDGEPMTLSYNPLDKLNACMEKVPAEQKEEFKTNNSRSGEGEYMELMSSTLYDNEDGAVCGFWIFSNGKFEPEVNWTNNAAIYRPILSF